MAPRHSGAGAHSHSAGAGDLGRSLCGGGLCRRPPLPPRVPAAPAIVLLEAGGWCGRAGPGLRAVGGAGIVIPAEAEKGARPPLNPLRTASGTAVPDESPPGGRIRRPPDPPLRSALRYGECVSRGEGHPPLSILSPPHGLRQPGYVLGSCGTGCRLVRGWGVWPRGGAEG